MPENVVVRTVVEERILRPERETNVLLTFGREDDSQVLRFDVNMSDALSRFILTKDEAVEFANSVLDLCVDVA